MAVVDDPIVGQRVADAMVAAFIEGGLESEHCSHCSFRSAGCQDCNALGR